MASEEAIADALATQTGIEHVRLDDLQPEEEALRRVPEALARRFELVALRIEGANLVVAMANPTDIVAIDEVQRSTDLFVRVVSSPRSQIARAMNRCYHGEGDAGIEDLVERALESVRGDQRSEAGVIDLVNRLLEIAAGREATDVHLEPDELVIRTRLRIDGELQHGPALPVELASALVSRVKVMADLDISETRMPQDGKFRFQAGTRCLDVRVSTFPSVFGESLVLRILDASRAALPLDRLGLGASHIQTLMKAARRPTGMILVTGPTGSGKTTTLYGLLRATHSITLKTITLEDPVEYRLPMITQCQINERAGVTFAAGLRAILRHDPDVVLVGEMRDEETAQIAVRAALTGHLVLSTLHTNDAISTVDRLRDMGVPPYLVGASLNLILAQRLVRLLCPECRVPYDAAPEELEALGLEPGGTWYDAKGCDLCRECGVRGRSALFEVLPVSREIARAIHAGEGSRRIEQIARDEGFVPFRDAALARAQRGEISLAEVARVGAGD